MPSVPPGLLAVFQVGMEGNDRAEHSVSPQIDCPIEWFTVLLWLVCEENTDYLNDNCFVAGNRIVSR